MRIRALIGALTTTLVAATRLAAQDVWIAHITDPHVFEEPKKLWLDPWRGEKFDTTWKTQQRGNRRAFLAALHALSTLPTATIRPRALVITGDFGLDSGWWTKKAAESSARDRHPRDTARREPDHERLHRTG
jgi:3',5'-cyclic AMP phosphodiesterase CpdA